MGLIIHSVRIRIMCVLIFRTRVNEDTTTISWPFKLQAQSNIIVSKCKLSLHVGSYAILRDFKDTI
jgi:hypothetical protein